MFSGRSRLAAEAHGVHDDLSDRWCKDQLFVVVVNAGDALDAVDDLPLFREDHLVPTFAQL